jgi:hypothetical protein
MLQTKLPNFLCGESGVGGVAAWTAWKREKVTAQTFAVAPSFYSESVQELKLFSHLAIFTDSGTFLTASNPFQNSSKKIFKSELCMIEWSFQFKHDENGGNVSNYL